MFDKYGKSHAQSLSACALFAALIAMGAFIKIPVPFMDYFTLQILFVLLSGMLLGARLGAISVLVYIGVGLAGIPIFAAGGGIQYILRPSFGYLLGFVGAAWISGWICEKYSKKGLKGYLAGAYVGMGVTYLIGFTYKYLILNMYMQEITPLSVIILSAFPLDIPGDIVLSLISSFLGRRLNQSMKQRGIK